MLSPELAREVNGEPKPVREKALHHVCQRTRKDVQTWFEEANQKFPFPAREPATQTEAPVELHRDYFRILEKLDKVLDFVSLHAQHAHRAQPVEWLRLHLHRRALSSPEALRQSLENRIEKLSKIINREEKKETVEPLPINREAEADNVDSLLASVGDKGGSDVETEDDRDRGADTAILSIEQRLQLQYFNDLLSDLKGIKPSKDRKLAALRDDVLPVLFSKAGGETPAKVIVFTRFKATLFYLEKELGRAADYEIITMHGDLSEAARDQCFEQFAVSKKAILLATDVISEGLNLQTIACMVCHFDIPWNPNRLEQRTGRVDRFGQRAPMVYVRMLFCRDTTDEEVMHHLVRKLERIRHDLGFSPPLYATEETVLRVLARRHQRRTEPLSGGQRGLFDEEEESFFDKDALQRIQSEGFYGQADVRIRDVSERLREMHERFGSPEQIRRFMKVGLRRYNCSVDEKKDGTLRVEVNNPRLRVPGLPSVFEKAVLDPEERNLHPDAVILDVGHPLIRRLNAVIREDALRQSEEGARTAAYYVQEQRGTLLLGHGLLRATARTNPPVLLEEVITFGIRGGVSGFQMLSAEEIAAAQEREPQSRMVNKDEAISRIRMLYEQDVWQTARERAIAQALERLHAHRTELKAELEPSGAGGLAWLKGFDEVEEVGFDLYCLTLLLPEGA
jgi:superfamily II DNA/RNA helicase